MYLANGEALSAALDSLPDNMTDEDLREQVTGTACEHLGSNWLAEIKERWLDHSEISPGEMRLLSSALERHAKGDYEGCVSLLMGLFEDLRSTRLRPQKSKKRMNHPNSLRYSDRNTIA